MARLVVIAACLGPLLGCAKEPARPGGAESSDTASRAIKALIPEASSIANADLQRLQEGWAGVEQMENQSLTLVLMSPTEPMADAGAARRDFEVLSDDRDKVRGAPHKSQAKGYGTLIQPEFITDFECRVKGDTATGVVAFQAETLYRGQVEYRARRTAQGWQVDEFRLPGARLKVTRGADGKWQKARLGGKD
jgi:hypothetical protein